MSINPFIHVRSPKFAVLPGEDAELVNEGMYGKSIAIYLEEKLKAAGYTVPFYCCEDWGWWVEISDQGCQCGAAIYGRLDEKTNQLLASVTAWPQPEKVWSWRRFRSIDYTPLAQKIYADVLHIFKTDADVQVIAINDNPFME